jgi:CheY-like chemotaxis protein
MFASTFAARELLSARAYKTRAAVKRGNSRLVHVYGWLTGAMILATLGITVSEWNRSERRDARMQVQAARQDDAAQRYSEAVAAIAAAQAAAANDTTGGQRLAQRVDPAHLTRALHRVVTPAALRSTKGAKLLWVDDHPDNNLYEEEALRAVGINVVSVLTTEAALDAVQNGDFDMVISDASRQNNPGEGLQLLSRLRSAGEDIPVIIYRGATTESTRAEAVRAGALTETADPIELLTSVVTTLEQRRGVPSR